MRRSRAAAFALAFFLFPASVWAHTPSPGAGAFYGGMLHPLVVPAHVLVLLGLGLWIGQQGIRHAEVGLPSFLLGLAVGLPAAGLGYVTRELPSPLFLTLATITGLWTAASWPLPRGVIGVGAVVVGVIVGLDSPPDLADTHKAILALLGTAIGSGLLVVHAIAIADYFQRPWQRIGVRVAGSWISAISIMVLALAFAPQRTAGIESGGMQSGARSLETTSASTPPGDTLTGGSDAATETATR